MIPAVLLLGHVVVTRQFELECLLGFSFAEFRISISDAQNFVRHRLRGGLFLLRQIDRSRQSDRVEDRDV